MNDLPVARSRATFLALGRDHAAWLLVRQPEQMAGHLWAFRGTEWMKAAPKCEQKFLLFVRTDLIFAALRGPSKMDKR
jgi:hypothetical protein